MANPFEPKEPRSAEHEEWLNEQMDSLQALYDQWGELPESHERAAALRHLHEAGLMLAECEPGKAEREEAEAEVHAEKAEGED